MSYPKSNQLYVLLYISSSSTILSSHFSSWVAAYIPTSLHDARPPFLLRCGCARALPAPRRGRIIVMPTITNRLQKVVFPDGRR